MMCGVLGLRCVDVEGKNVSRSGGGRWGLYSFSIGFSGVIQGKATYNGESGSLCNLNGPKLGEG